jgi:manganese oxidase
MMTGFAQFGAVEMGGMFSVVKVREGLAANDYKDPGWFKHPDGSVAYELTGESKNAQRAPGRTYDPTKTAEFRVVKPGRNRSHNHN